MPIETLIGTIISPAFGGKGWMHCGAAVFEYSSAATVALTFIAADEGNGSYAPQPVTLPATGGQITKYFFKPSPAKWKLLQIRLDSTDPALQVYFAGTIVYCKAWGSLDEYAQLLPFANGGGEG